MLNLTISFKNKGLPFLFVLLLGLGLVSGVAGCGGGSNSGDAPVDDADPKGYYTGSASIKEEDDITDLAISDLQGMVSGNRFMFISVEKVLLYDGIITNINENNYTATVAIYKDGVLLTDTTVSGSINSTSSITGTFAGAGAGNGIFTLTYSTNNSPSDLARIDIGWRGPLNGALSEIETTFINSAGDVSRMGPFSNVTPVLDGCDYDTGSAIQAIADINVYSVSLILAGCDNALVNGSYTGFATTQSVADTLLVLGYSNANYSGSGELPFD